MLTLQRSKVRSENLTLMINYVHAFKRIKILRALCFIFHFCTIQACWVLFWVTEEELLVGREKDFFILLRKLVQV